MFAGYFFKGVLNDWGPGYLYYIVEIIGFLVFFFGIFQFFKAKSHVHEKGSEGYTALRNEVFLNTLARMTYADSNTKASEVKTVQKVYKKHTGKAATEAEVRVAARGDLHETKSFDKFLTSAGAKLSQEDKLEILEAMREVVAADGNISPGELEFFDIVGKAFKLSASEIAALKK